MAKTINIAPEALEVLKRGTFNERADSGGQWEFRLPQGHLERKLYEAVNKALAAAGGKWSKALQAHLFSRDPREELRCTVMTGKAVNRQQTLQLFPTPPAVATRMVELLELDSSHVVLEPSAGTGRLLDAVLRECDPALLIVVEKDEKLSGDLLTAYSGGSPARTFFTADFLSWDPSEAGLSPEAFDRIVMNPPFERGADLKHIQRALDMLSPGGRLVTVCAAGPKQRQAYCRQPEQYLEKPGGTRTPHPWVSVWQTLPAKTFAKEGTDIETALVLFIRPEL